MSEPLLRPAVRDDIDTLVHFNAAMALETEHKHLDLDTLRNGITAVFDDPARGFYRVVEVEGTVIAGALVTFEWSDWRNGQWWWLQSVYVLPPWRGRGVFGRLYRSLRDEARRTPSICGLRLYVERDNVAAQRVYAALGMQPEPYLMLHDEF